MADTTFQYGQLVDIGWMQDVNNAVYRAIGSGGTAPATPAQVISNLNLATLFAALHGSASNTFLVASSTAGTSQAVPRSQADSLYAASGSGVLSFNTRTGAVTLTSSDVTTALGFTPANATNVVNNISFGTTGLTPSTSTVGAVTVAGTLAITNGGTGLTALGTGVQTALGTAVTGTGGIVLAASPTVSGDWGTFNSAKFSSTTIASPIAGQLWYDGGYALNFQMDNNVTAQLAEDDYIYVKASSAITMGQLCYFTGAVGASGVVTVAPAPSGVTNPDYIVGIAAENIALNGFGLIQVFGSIKGFDTTGSAYGETWSTGDILYYNPASGGLTHTYPANGIIVTVAAVTNAGSGGSGSLLVRVTSKQRELAGTGLNVIQTQGGTTYSLANISIGVGSYGSASQVGTFTVNGQGQLTAASNVSISIAPTQINSVVGTGAAVLANAPTVTGNWVFNSTGAITVPVGTTAQEPGTPAAGMLRFNSSTGLFEGYNGTVWASVGGGASLSNDTATATPVYPLFAHATSGTPTTIYTANSEYLFTPSTGVLQSPEVLANNGLLMNNTTVSTSYTIPAGVNAVSVGPISVAAGQSVTVTSGQRWVVL